MIFQEAEILGVDMSKLAEHKYLNQIEHLVDNIRNNHKNSLQLLTQVEWLANELKAKYEYSEVPKK